MAPGKGLEVPSAKMTQSVLELSTTEIEHQKDLLLHDPSYMQDKSVKKVSLATLKRRSKQVQGDVSVEIRQPAVAKKSHMSMKEMKSQFKQQMLSNKGFGEVLVP